MKRLVLLFLAAAMVGGAPGAAQAQESSTFWNLIRRKYDKDGDGKVTVEEYGKGAARHRNLDKNRDGVLGIEDFADLTPAAGPRSGSGDDAPAGGGEAPAGGDDARASGDGIGGMSGFGGMGGMGAGDGGAARPTDADIKFFETRVRPALVKHCYECHGLTGRARGGLRLDSAASIAKGGNSGATVDAEDLDASLLLRAVRYADEDVQMPPKGKLPADVLADFETWVQKGAFFPPSLKAERAPGTELAPGVEEEVAETSVPDRKIEWEKAKAHWVFRDPVKQPPPLVAEENWAFGPVDRYLLADMEAAGLKPVGDADKRTWLRRVTFDLTGLPPTPEEAEAFERDRRPEAYEAVVDRLLASPAFGERWGRHWLDVARYAESSGKDSNVVYPHAWRYRDYVVDAYNADVPFDRFLKEQIAGDLLPAQDAKERARLQTATGFLAIGSKGHNTRGREQFRMDVVDEQIDALTQAAMAFTVACARCHDHKFDPISQEDYYAVAGVFLSTETCYGTTRSQGNNYPSPLLELPEGSGAPRGATLTRTQRTFIEAARDRFKALAETGVRRGRPGADGGGATPAKPDPQQLQRMRIARSQVATIDEALERFGQDGRPTDKNMVAMGVRDARRPTDARRLERGEVEQPKERVPRGFLTILGSGDGRATFKKGSGRLDLAELIASPQNPLTARVYVNRVWSKLFGVGIVPTPDNFGHGGRAPTHPALLDYLAVEFVEGGWSTKALIKTLCLSRAYRLSSESTASNEKIDPEATKRWRMPKRRLEAEALRDAMLATAGTLKLERPAGSPANILEGVVRNEEVLRLFGEEAPVRSVYLPVLRNHVPHALEVFDFAEPSFVTGDREETNVASQALFMMNAPEVRKQAAAFADRVTKGPGGDDAKIARAFELALGRKPTSSEVSAARSFFEAYRAAPAKKVEPPRRPGFRPARGRRGLADASPADAVRPSAAEAKKDAWTSFCQALFMSAEFRYVD